MTKTPKTVLAGFAGTPSPAENEAFDNNYLNDAG